MSRGIGTVEAKLDGGKIKSLRLALGLSQKNAAEKAGINQPFWSNIEGGQTTSYPTAKKIASVLGVEVGALLEKMPGDVKRDPDAAFFAWLDFIEGKTRELQDAITAATSPEELPMDLVVEVEKLHRDISTYAGPRFELERGDSRISLALDDMKFAVEEAYKARFGSRTDPKEIMDEVMAEEEEGARKTA